VGRHHPKVRDIEEEPAELGQRQRIARIEGDGLFEMGTSLRHRFGR
jgi:hypothetical protein